MKIEMKNINIVETVNYDQFTLFKSNRSINQGLVNRLKLSIKKYGYIKSRPIIVNKEKKIIDGQHRMFACKELKIPIVYSEVDSKLNPQELMIDLNANQDVWRMNEYVSHWSELGIDFYKKLKKFDDEYSFGISNSISICAFHHGGVPANQIRKGVNLNFNTRAVETAEYIKLLKGLQFYKSSHFVRAIVKFISEYGTKENKETLLRKHMVITKQGGTSEYLAVIENIVNKRRDEKNKINLTGKM